MKDNQDFSDWILEVQHSDQPEIDKLKAVFGHLTAQIVELADKEIELARAMQDRETLVKVLAYVSEGSTELRDVLVANVVY